VVKPAQLVRERNIITIIITNMATASMTMPEIQQQITTMWAETLHSVRVQPAQPTRQRNTTATKKRKSMQAPPEIRPVPLEAQRAILRPATASSVGTLPSGLERQALPSEPSNTSETSRRQNTRQPRETNLALPQAWLERLPEQQQGPPKTQSSRDQFIKARF
jgi:hypothetical protein